MIRLLHEIILFVLALSIDIIAFIDEHMWIDNRRYFSAFAFDTPDHQINIGIELLVEGEVSLLITMVDIQVDVVVRDSEIIKLFVDILNILLVFEGIATVLVSESR
jgi:hypothetical protein